MALQTYPSAREFSGISTGSDPVVARGLPAFVRLRNLAQGCISRLVESGTAAATIGRIRGSGPGVSFGALVDELRSRHPRDLKSPFENSPNVAGALWRSLDVLGEGEDAFMLLRFEAGCEDLPLHAHLHSDRVLFAVAGRGFFHVSAEGFDAFTGDHVRTVPVRTRDAVMFRRGTIHTFSAPGEPMTLLSYHDPFVDLDAPEQYSIPSPVLRPSEVLRHAPVADVTCDPAWTVLA